MVPTVPAERFALLLELSRAFGARLELDALLRLVLERTSEALGAEGCSVLALDRAAGQLYFLASSDPALRGREPLADLRFPADRGVAGRALREGRALLVSDVASDASFFPDIDAQTGVRTRSLLCAPLPAPDGALGVIEVVNRRGGGAFGDEDLAFLDALAGSLAVALENARLYAAVRSDQARLEREVSALRRERRQRERFADVVGSAPAMERVFALMEVAAESSITVLLQGETGVGKELVARAIHRHGPRRDRPFLAVHCGALPESLLESELFGYRRGAFTGAVEDRAGLFEAAHGGTLFLDEIGETTPATQVKLLRALQEGEIRRVGDTRVRKVDVRVISATNRALTGEGAEGFRQDLYYRLAVFPILVPPLRERREDVPALVSQLLERARRRLGKAVAGIEPAALERLAAYDWPGNVRELENEIERAVALAPSRGTIALSHLSERVFAPRGAGLAAGEPIGPLREARAAFERRYVAAALARCEGNATRAARSLGLSRQMMQRKIREYGLRAT